MPSSSKKVTVGYKYYLGVHFILCRGPIDKILRVRVDDKDAYTQASEGGTIAIDQPGLFGGEKREGGIQGNVDFEFGEETQTQNDYLQAKIETNVPAFRTVVSAILRQVYIGTNPYLKKWAFKAQRVFTTTDGATQWYSTKAGINPPVQNIGNPNIDYTEDFSGDLSAYTEPYSASNYYISSGRLVINDDGIPTGNNDVGLIRNFETPIFVNSWTFDFTPGEQGSGDMGAVNIGGGMCNFNPQREALVDSQRRAYFFGTALSPAQLLSGTTYTLSGIRNPANDEEFTATLVITSTGTVVATRTYAVPAPILDADKTTVYALGGNQDGSSYSGGMSCTYDNIAIRSTIPNEITDMNPAHIIREIITDPDWGMGYATADVDDTSFTAAADTLFNESFGLSLIWDRAKPIEDFLSDILAHIDAALYISRTTGKFVLKLIRNDYSVSALTRLDEDSIITVDEYDQISFGELVNTVSVVYTDHEYDNTESVTIQDIALVQQQGEQIHTTRQYVGITYSALALRVAQRDLLALSSQLINCKIIVNRTAANINPGDAFILDWPEYGINELVMRAQSISYGNATTNQIMIQCTQDIFSTPTVSTMASPDIVSGDDYPALPTTNRIFTEVPYYELATTLGTTEINQILQDDNFASFAISAAGSPTDYHVNADLEYDAGSGYETVDTLEFCPVLQITQDITPAQTLIFVSEISDIGNIEVGEWCQIGDEIMRVDSLPEQDSTGQYSMLVGRGCLDTTPRPHQVDSSGQFIYFWQDLNGNANTQYTYGDALNARILTVTPSDVLLASEDTPDSLVIRGRPILPYPPGNLLIEGESYPVYVQQDSADNIAVSWATRNRLQQTSGTIYDHTEGDISPEASTTYTVRLFNQFGGLEEEQTGLTVTETSVNMAPLISDHATIEVVSIRDGFECWMPAKHYFEWNFIDSGLSATDAIDSIGSANSVGGAPPSGIPTDYIAHYTFDNISGATVFDESTNSNDATLNGSPSIAAGSIGNAVFFDATNDYVALPATLLHLSTAALAFRVRSTGDLVSCAAAGDIATDDNYFEIQFNNAALPGRMRILQRVAGGAAYSLTTDNTFANSAWHSVVIQASPADSKPEIWVNGVNQSTTVGSGAYNTGFFNGPSGLDNSSIGALLTSVSRYRGGAVDEWYLYNRKLTSTEISALAV